MYWGSCNLFTVEAKAMGMVDNVIEAINHENSAKHKPGGYAQVNY